MHRAGTSPISALQQQLSLAAHSSAQSTLWPADTADSLPHCTICLTTTLFPPSSLTAQPASGDDLSAWCQSELKIFNLEIDVTG